MLIITEYFGRIWLLIVGSLYIHVLTEKTLPRSYGGLMQGMGTDCRRSRIRVSYFVIDSNLCGSRGGCEECRNLADRLRGVGIDDGLWSCGRKTGIKYPRKQMTPAPFGGRH
ncbi:hypothetical protein IQ07DRAFT_74808 [Pyrenochaeta sp. DS3sAY3a]|nr:hypothetical protein IQ07DRAFT_74808 [Pyrenochaeta sp. DS3sAY3a]